MLIEVKDFCDRVESDLAGMVDELQALTGRYGDNERQAWMRSLAKLSVMLAKPALGPLHLHLGQSAGLALEYRLPASSSWCDAVLLGHGTDGPAAVILELKDWDLRSDVPGPRESLIEHKGSLYLHPSDQVRGYAEYCQRFHSAVVEDGATVSGCVLFTGSGDATAYRQPPHATLVSEYPVFTAADADTGLVPFVCKRLVKPNPEFAERFDNGVYKQDRNFVVQVSKAIKASRGREFVLLDEQRRGYEVCLEAIDALVAKADPQQKLVVIIEGPPGSGKSVIAANLWAALANDTRLPGNIVLTTTSGSQRANWEEMFSKAYEKAAKGMVVPANRYNPGLSPAWVTEQREAGKDVRVGPWKENIDLFLKQKKSKSPDNLFAVSICDEAHALIDPTAPGAEGVPPSGWSMHAGPQVHHIIRSSRVSIFLMDGEQSYRDNETTTKENIQKFATELGVTDVRVVSLAGNQFRCGGSKEYVDWLEAVLGLAEKSEAIAKLDWRRKPQGKGKFLFDMVDDPQALEEAVRDRLQEGKTARLMATYAREWVTKRVASPHELSDHAKDFHIAYKRGAVEHHWSRIWNYAPDEDYSLFIQRPEGSRMHDDPLCEVGCPYVVRGFDYDYLGVLWLSDLVRRGNRWVAQDEHIFETAWPRTRKAARDHAGEPDHPAVQKLVHRLARGYRILLSRAIHGVYLWVEDGETREYLRQCLGEFVHV